MNSLLVICDKYCCCHQLEFVKKFTAVQCSGYIHIVLVSRNLHLHLGLRKLF